MVVSPAVLPALAVPAERCYQPHASVYAFINETSLFQLPQLVQYPSRLISSRAASSTDVAFPIASVRQKQSPLKFPPGKNHFAILAGQHSDASSPS